MAGNKRAEGTEKERIAMDFLQSRGVKIVAANFHFHKCGEIDLIGYDEGYLVFFEVKYRKSDFSGNAAEAVNYKKQRTISRVADFYLLRYGVSVNSPMRFDVVAIDSSRINWHKNAFDYIPR